MGCVLNWGQKVAEHPERRAAVFRRPQSKGAERSLAKPILRLHSANDAPFRSREACLRPQTETLPV